MEAKGLRLGVLGLVVGRHWRLLLTLDLFLCISPREVILPVSRVSEITELDDDVLSLMASDC